MVIPRRLQAVAAQLSSGHFRQGLEELNKIYNDSAHVDRILMSEFLLRCGDRTKAHKLLVATVDLPGVPIDLKARGYELLAFLTKQRQGLDQALRLYDEALRLAERSKDIEQLCRTQLWMMAAKADAHGPDSLGVLASEIAWNVTKTGDPSLRVFLHTTFAEIEGRRSEFEPSRRHIDLALALLENHTNLWMEARLYLLRGAMAHVTCDLEQAIAHTLHALVTSRASGCRMVESAALCNLGQFCVQTGKIDEAVGYLESARVLTQDVRSQRSAVVDNLAQVALLKGNLAACEAHLQQLSVPENDQRYVDLDNQATRIRLLQRLGDFDTALEVADEATHAAASRAAHLLHAQYCVLHADVLVDIGRIEEAQALVSRAEGPISRSSLVLLADVQRVQARIAARLGRFALARARFDRAARVLKCLGYISSYNEVLQLRSIELNEHTRNGPRPRTSVSDRRNVWQHVITDTATWAARVLDFGHIPSLLGTEAVELIRQTRSAARLALTRVREGEAKLIRHVRWPDVVGSELNGNVIRHRFETREHGSYELLIEPRTTLGADELIRSVLSLVTKAIQLHQANRDRVRQTPLWPSEIALPDGEPVFYSQKMRELRQQAVRMASTEMKVLITGETGVGKEVIARLIHDSSKRAGKPFEAVNCSSLARELFEDQLFGHRKGAFTGAISDSLGILRANDGGTIFFDEIGELSLEGQVKLLRVMEGREVQPLGSTKSLSVDFRIIAATNADLQQLMTEKRFRNDLFYRLNVGTLRVPPLRERREEILPLAQYFLSLYCAQNNRPLLALSDEAQEHLLLYDWPGNVRQLKNEMERLAGMVEPGTRIKASDLTTEIRTARYARPIQETAPNELVVRLDQKLDDAFDLIVRHAIPAALQRNNNVYAAAARDLGITRKGLYNKRIRLGMIPPPAAKPVKRRATKKRVVKRRAGPTRSRRSAKPKKKAVKRVVRRAKRVRRRG